MTDRPPFPTVIDSSMIAHFRSCRQKFFREYMQHWKPQGESIHLVAGKAFARGLEVARREFYEKGATPDNALGAGLHALMVEWGEYQAPEGVAKSLERTCGALEFYFDAYQFHQDAANPLIMPSKRRAIEFSFAQPLPYKHPETGDPIIYAGRSDMIADFADGVYIEDDKTTSQLGASWSKQWDLRSQFTSYCWAAREAGMAVNGVLVRGVSILKTKYETQQAITYRSGWEIDRWLRQVLRDLKAMQECWEEEYWDYNLDHACTEYGGCSFQPICKSPDPDTWLPVYFERRRWDPLTREETKLEEAA